MKSKLIVIILIISITICGASFFIPSGVDQNVSSNSFQNTITPTPFMPAVSTPTMQPKPQGVYLTGAGDISICGEDGDDQTAPLLADIPGYIFALGDNQNDEGEPETFSRCFDASWGQYKDRMIPVVGNHEYFTENACGYFDYFGDAAGQRGKGYYSRDVGAWHIVVINSICDEVGGCDPGSEMITWLENDLSTDNHLCTLAMWHIPRFSTGYHGGNDSLDTIWRTVVAHDVELVLNGHEHDYERFTPMDENGEVNIVTGTRQIIVGTGGAPLRKQYGNNENSEVFYSSSHGVLKLFLDYGYYTWEYIPVNADGFTDTGTGYCH
ncbi:MAG: metallophosphoesterase [Anaerolineaceae bacterium]|nr:metallophosphoesterase [Anaerolineaceae bacterium]